VVVVRRGRGEAKAREEVVVPVGVDAADAADLAGLRVGDEAGINGDLV
jgi:hypothetical protein